MGYDAYVHINKKYTKSNIEKLLNEDNGSIIRKHKSLVYPEPPLHGASRWNLIPSM